MPCTLGKKCINEKCYDTQSDTGKTNYSILKLYCLLHIFMKEHLYSLVYSIIDACCANGTSTPVSQDCQGLCRSNVLSNVLSKVHSNASLPNQDRFLDKCENHKAVIQKCTGGAQPLQGK